MIARCGTNSPPKKTPAGEALLQRLPPPRPGIALHERHGSWFPKAASPAYTSGGLLCTLGDPFRPDSIGPAGGRASGCHRNLDEPAHVAARTVEVSSSCAHAAGAPLPEAIHWRGNRCCKTRARSAIAIAAGLCDLPCPLSTRHDSQRVHRAHEPLARNGAGRRRERTTRLPLS